MYLIHTIESNDLIAFLSSAAQQSLDYHLYYRTTLAEYNYYFIFALHFEKVQEVMEVLDHYAIPFMGLKVGIHQLKFVVDDAFFAQFEHSLIEAGKLDVILDLDKRPDMSIFDFSIAGEITIDCDRCTEPFVLPLDTKQRLHAKYSEVPLDGDDEVIYIDSAISKLQLSQYIYEYIHLAIPMYKSCDDSLDENAACNETILEQLSYPDDDQPKSNPIWDKLNDLNFDS